MRQNRSCIARASFVNIKLYRVIFPVILPETADIRQTMKSALFFVGTPVIQRRRKNANLYGGILFMFIKLSHVIFEIRKKHSKDKNKKTLLFYWSKTPPQNQNEK